MCGSCAAHVQTDRNSTLSKLGPVPLGVPLKAKSDSRPPSAWFASGGHLCGWVDPLGKLGEAMVGLSLFLDGLVQQLNVGFQAHHPRELAHGSIGGDFKVLNLLG